MPAWPGGPCPNCGEDVPANIVSCRNCRTLLNTDLQRDSVEIPAFVPLEEVGVLIDLVPKGAWLPCPNCQQELKIAFKYFGRKVQCKHCEKSFRPRAESRAIRAADVYARCPHCDESLRFNRKYVGQKVACKFCSGRLRIVASEEVAE